MDYKHNNLFKETCGFTYIILATRGSLNCHKCWRNLGEQEIDCWSVDNTSIVCP